MRILLFGDSHTVGPYGEELERRFRDVGYDVVRVAQGGASAVSLLPTGIHSAKLAEAVTRGPYDLAIITLGTNDATNSSSVSVERSARALRELADTLPADDVFWVGSPAFSAEIASTLYPVFASEDLNSRAQRLWLEASPGFPGRAIDPRVATLPFVSSSDVHFGRAGGRAWASFVFDAVRSAPSKIVADSSRWSPFLIGGLAAAAVWIGYHAARRR